MAKHPPKIITLACQKLPDLVYSSFFRYGRSEGIKAMKCDYAEKFLILLESLLWACVMQFDGKLCRVSGNVGRPYTVREMSLFTHIHQRTVERMLHDLKDLKLIQSDKQFIRMFPEGLKVAAVWRVFTRQFWEKLGLWSLFVESVKYATRNGNLKFKNPLKWAGKKKSASAKEEEKQKSKKNNQLFLFMSSCEHRIGEKACSGQYMAAEVCAMCHRFSA